MFLFAMTALVKTLLLCLIIFVLILFLIVGLMTIHWDAPLGCSEIPEMLEEWERQAKARELKNKRN
jgi:hypothetical protein